jgi:hypothetical protein
VVRLRQRERFRARRENEDETAGEEQDARRIQFRRASQISDKRIRPRSVSLMVALFIVVLLTILFLG